ncbi:hypothetical protein CcaverHIS631_0204650 [Cutaneotrichosporon cavernicola]|nr:hypothetical protein CcaverHIS631_0204650 [Cutaneotrichosporon cavernicola]
MPYARPDVFFSAPAVDESPTIKRYREPRILAPVHRSRASPRRRKCSVTPTASPQTYKTRGSQGVERALEDLMQGLKVAAAPRVEPPSAWSESERERESWRDGDGGWFARSKNPAEPRRSGSIRHLAASLRSKSSLSLRSKPRGPPAEFGPLPSANSSTWSFGSRPATPSMAPLPTYSQVPGPQAKGFKLGFIQRLKRSRGPIPEVFMANHIPQTQEATTNPTSFSTDVSHAPRPSSPSSRTSHQTLRRKGTLRPERPETTATPVSNHVVNNGSLSRPLYAADARTMPTQTFGPRTPTSMRSVPGGQLGQSKMTSIPAATGPTLAVNKGTAGSFTRPTSDDRRSAGFIMTRSAEHAQVISQSNEPITPTKRSSSLSASSLKKRSLALLPKSPISPKSPKSPKSPTSPSHSFPTFGLSPTFPSFTLPLRRRSKLPPLSISTSDMLHTGPSASPHLSPMMPCNRPLSKAEAILGVRLDSFSLDGRVSPNLSGDSSDDEVVSFTTPKGARRSALSVASMNPSPSRPASPSRWLTYQHKARTPDLSFESLSELSEAATAHPATPPHTPPPRTHRARDASGSNRGGGGPFEAQAVAAQPQSGRRPYPPLPVEYGGSPAVSPDLDISIPIAPAHSLYRSSIYSPASGLNDVITRNFRQVNTLPTPPPPRRRPQSTQIAAPAPVPIAPEARLPPHSERSPWPPKWEDEFNPDAEVALAPLMPSNASVHTFGTSAASYRSRASNASSFFDFNRMDVDDE